MPSTTTAGVLSARGPVPRSPRPAWASGSRSPPERLSQLDATGWELYHVAEDPAETRNLAAEHRDRLIAMIALWYVEAGRNGVLPIDGSALERMVAREASRRLRRASATSIARTTQAVPFFAGPRVLNRPHSITASVDIPEGGAEGVLLMQGSAAGGYSLFIKDGRLRYVHNWVGREIHGVTSEGPVPDRVARAALRVRAHGGRPTWPHGRGAPGRLQLYVDGTLVGASEAPGDHARSS